MDDIGDVEDALSQLLPLRKGPFFVVMDPVNSSVDPDMLEAIIRLPRLVSSDRVGVILISTSEWYKLYTQRRAPAVMHADMFFPALAPQELIRLCAKERPADVSPQLWESFLNAVIKPAHRASLQLSDMQMLVGDLSPVLQRAAQQLQDVQPALIIAHIMPTMQRHRDAFHAHYPGCARRFEASNVDQPGSSGGSAIVHPQAIGHADVLSMELPYLGKFLVLAAYLCSCNRATADRRIFDAASGKRAKRKNTQATDRQGEEAREEAVSQGQVRRCMCGWRFNDLSCCDIVALVQFGMSGVNHVQCQACPPL